MSLLQEMGGVRDGFALDETCNPVDIRWREDLAGFSRAYLPLQSTPGNINLPE